MGILDNLSAHKVPGTRELIETCGAQLLYLPPYSSDLNLIEKALSKFKKFLRDAKAQTQEALDQAVTDVLKTITPRKRRRLVPALRIRDTATVVSL